MQQSIFVGPSISEPNGIGGVVAAGPNATLPYTPASGNTAGSGAIGRYQAQYDAFGQAAFFWNTMDVYAQQHTVEGFLFELGNVANTSVTQVFIDSFLNNIDNCLARRVAYGLGATMPAIGSGAVSNSSGSPYPSLYPLNPGMESNKSNAGLAVAVVANDTLLTQADLSAMMPLLMSQQVSITVVAPHVGPLQSGVNATGSFITVSSVLYDAVFIGSTAGNTTSTALSLSSDAESFVMEAYSHGKAIGALGSSGMGFLQGMGLSANSSLGLYAGAADQVTMNVLSALSGPVRFPQRFPIDDVATICGMA